MKHIKRFNEDFKDSLIDIIDRIKYLKKLPKEYKEVAYGLLDVYTVAKDGKITGLRLHPDLEKRIKEQNLPCGFSMGIDKDGFFIHTHRGRCKSKESVDDITAEDMISVESTG